MHKLFFKDEQSKEEKLSQENTGKEEKTEDISGSVEQEKEKREINTVADFIDYLEDWGVGSEKDDSLRGKAAAQIIKIRVGLSAAGLRAETVKVRQMPGGVLGLFDPASRQIEISEEMLADFNSDKRLIETVFVHEETHKGGIADEGLTQLSVRKKISAKTDIYSSEQEAAKRTFYRLGVATALKLYDLDHPYKLFERFLGAGLKYKYGHKLDELSDRKKLEKIAKEESVKLSTDFKKGAQRLYDALELQGYDFRKSVREILSKLVEK